MAQIVSNLEKEITGSKRTTMAISIYMYNYLLKSFIGNSIQILPFLLAFTHTELGACVIPSARHSLQNLY